ncbi:3-keto-steroid reductase [Taphrina deformans PYCC 5710]|uniref:3-keto-steroid reductase n=1 Tax=Taphrina deformans (strain PYCC 5710 / ATCC 11124 / CBS 356.35 / IMI 108563 / JCM 9778 / NBRC 8474) TaxID=1097556 RepID=R4XER1_TAPDE|nr:3-keto-steroid reductase [Taphrina deformans PYCC 5710]|eukprot:CCG82961.1 3-keto-steroid reductase [Taphrina deformans PYCC 5710]
MDALTKYFFLAHIPITLLVDLSPLYPNRGFFALSHWIKQFYLSTFNDPLVGGLSNPGGWFASLLFLEGVVQLPHSPLTRLVVISYSAQVATATWACLFECLSFPATTVSVPQKLCLIGFYVPYLVIPSLMGWHNAVAIASTMEENREELQYLRQRPLAGATTVRKRIMITGANSGVGFGIVQQVIHQNSIALALKDIKITFVLTVRDQAKADSILFRLKDERAKYGTSIVFDFVYMDLLSMDSIDSAADKVIDLSNADMPLDVLICNAGMVEVIKIDLIKATLQAIFHPVEAISQPNYKVQKLGSKTRDGIATTFQANYFGHYYLVHKLSDKKVLTADSAVIWMSSMEATAGALISTDVQALTHRKSYESSKRVIDVSWSARQATAAVPEYLVHPGYCTTNILSGAVSKLLNPAWTNVFHIVRMCGMKFHVATAYNGAYAASKIALNPEQYDQRKKWGSALSRSGIPYVCETEYDAITPKDETSVANEVDRLINTFLQ